MLRILAVACALVALAGCVEKQKPLDAERQLLLSGADFADYQAPPEGRYSKQVNYGSRTIELTYKSAQSDGFYLHSGVSLHPRPSDAMIASYAEAFGVDIALRNGHLEQQPLELQMDIASRASLQLLLDDGKPVGNLFYASVGDKSLFALFLGVHFENAEQFASFIEPKLLALKDYDHQDPLLGWAGRKLGLGSD